MNKIHLMRMAYDQDYRTNCIRQEQDQRRFEEQQRINRERELNRQKEEQLKQDRELELLSYKIQQQKEEEQRRFFIESQIMQAKLIDNFARQRDAESRERSRRDKFYHLGLAAGAYLALK